MSTCGICLENIQDTLNMECGHKFCEKCIRQWLFEHSTCPMCRAEVDPLERGIALRYCLSENIYTTADIKYLKFSEDTSNETKNFFRALIISYFNQDEVQEFVYVKFVMLIRVLHEKEPEKYKEVLHALRKMEHTRVTRYINCDDLMGYLTHVSFKHLI